MNHKNYISFESAPFEIIDGDRGKNYPKQQEYSDSGYCLFLNASNVTSKGFDFSTCQFITEQKDSALRKGKLKRDDLILTTRGTVGNSAFFHSYIVLDHMRINSGMVIFRCNKEKILPVYLYHFMRSPQFYGQVNSLISGVAQPQLPIRDLRRIMMPLPNLYIQRSMSLTLSAYDDLIENNRRRIQLLEHSARLLYKEWFVSFRFPGHEHLKIKDGVPEGWERQSLGSLCEEIRESVLPGSLEPDTPYIGLEHIPRRSIALNEWSTADQVTSSKHLFREGEILFGKIRPYFHKVGIAFVDGVASSDAIVIRPYHEDLRALVLMTVSSDGFVAVTAQTMKEGSKMPRADWKQMQQYVVPLPPEGLLLTFNSIIEPIIQQLKTLSFENRNLTKARDILLPRLMNREVMNQTGVWSQR